MVQLIIMIVIAGAVYFGVEYYYKKNWDKNLDAQIKFSTDSAYPGDTIELYEVITNAKKLPVPTLNVKIKLDRRLVFKGVDSNSNVSDYSYKNDIFSIYSRQRITRKIPVECVARGYFSMDEIELISMGAYMGNIIHKSVPTYNRLVVYPAQIDVRSLRIPYEKIMGDVLINRRLYEDPFEFIGIREYQPFDTMNSVNWKATARTSELKVNVHGNTANKEVAIFLNLDNDGMMKMSKLQESSISIAASLTEMLVRDGISVSIITNGVDFETGGRVKFDSGSGIGHAEAVKMALARVDLNKEMQGFISVVEGSSANVAKDAVCVFVSFAHRKEIIDVIDNTVKKNGNGIWILPYIQGNTVELEKEAVTETVLWEVKAYD